MTSRESAAPTPCFVRSARHKDQGVEYAFSVPGDLRCLRKPRCSDGNPVPPIPRHLRVLPRSICEEPAMRRCSTVMFQHLFTQPPRHANNVEYLSPRTSWYPGCRSRLLRGTAGDVNAACSITSARTAARSVSPGVPIAITGIISTLFAKPCLAEYPS